jgi:hypothetical protein
VELSRWEIHVTHASIASVAEGDLRIGEYVGAGRDLIRTQPMDCKVGSTSDKCMGTPGAGPGGSTYGDFGKIIGGPEVHADGEIWGETLWDLRVALGQKVTEGLVTRAMELSPSQPSFLDMRNSIIQADTNTRSGKDINKIWRVFANRGMGYFAGSIDGNDKAPVEDFSLPPRANAPKANVSGTVTDGDTHIAVAGALVGFGGHTSGFPTDLAAPRLPRVATSSVACSSAPTRRSSPAGSASTARCSTRSPLRRVARRPTSRFVVTGRRGSRADRSRTSTARTTPRSVVGPAQRSTSHSAQGGGARRLSTLAARPTFRSRRNM